MSTGARTETLLRAIDALGRRFAHASSLDSSDALDAVGGDQALLCECLHFLTERDIVLFAADDARLFHRPTVVEDVMRSVTTHPETTPDEIGGKTGLPVAVVCQALGWLERDGRIVLLPESDGIRVRGR